MDKADGEHALPRVVALDLALHPVVVVRLLVQHDQDLALLELQLVVIVRVAVVQGTAPPVAAHQGIHL